MAILAGIIFYMFKRGKRKQSSKISETKPQEKAKLELEKELLWRF